MAPILIAKLQRLVQLSDVEFPVGVTVRLPSDGSLVCLQQTCARNLVAPPEEVDRSSAIIERE
jgi:hypothetical protein